MKSQTDNNLHQPDEQQDQAEQTEQQHTNQSEQSAAQDLHKKLETAQQEAQEWKNKCIQVTADMQNYKRRIEKEQALWTRHAQEEVLSKLLSIVDDFDRALLEHEKRERTPELDAWLEGFELISKALYKFLSDMDVVEIEQMETFDPTVHEAIAQVEVPDKQENDIVQVMQKGFMFKDEVLRPAKVTVAK